MKQKHPATAARLLHPLESSPAPENEVFPVVQQEKLDKNVARYVRMLAKEHPFILDIKVDDRQLGARLKERWPKIPGWEAQAEELIQHIDDIVHALPVLRR